MDENKKKALKEMINQLHSGASPEEVKERFGEVLENLSSVEIAKIEQELLNEGMPREQIQRLCDVHLAVMRDQLEKTKLEVPVGHPIGILLEEHKAMLQIGEKLSVLANKMKAASDKSYVAQELHNLEHISADFTDSEKHYLREENVLFPTLEKHGITEPPAIMWMDHNEIREKKKQLSKLLENTNGLGFQDFKAQLAETAKSLNSLLQNHFYKENNILFPTALQVITDEEWEESRREFNEIGYCSFTPQHLIEAATKEVNGEEAVTAEKDMLQFETGSLSKEEIEGIFDTLPVDISFVDRNDAVKYYNKADKRVFVRTKSVIGRRVQLCHPQKSIDIVNRIVDSFKTGKKDVAEFWITLNNRLVHIRYFAVRDKNGKYLGTMEVTQDLTDLKRIEGEKRLLDWKD